MHLMDFIKEKKKMKHLHSLQGGLQTNKKCAHCEANKFDHGKETQIPAHVLVVPKALNNASWDFWLIPQFDHAEPAN